MSTQNVAASAPLHHVVGRLESILEIIQYCSSQEIADAIQTLLFEIEQPWRDIEDAPQDGTVIIGATHDRRHIGAICMKWCEGDLEGAWVTERSHACIRWNPQCWIPVPPNPEVCGPAPLSPTEAKGDVAGSVSTAVVGQTESRETP